MKKRKFNILLNIAVLCMCVCAIAIGVYSAKTASLNVSGTIGFTAHNCKVRVLGKITGAVDSSNNALDPATTTALNYYDSTDNTKGKLIDGTADSWNFDKIYFDDLNAEDDAIATDIVFTFTLTNESTAYDVIATLNVNNLPDSIRPTVTFNLDSNNSGFECELKKDTAVTMTLTLSLLTSENISDATNNLDLTLSFDRVNQSQTAEALGYTLNSSDKSILTGVPTATESNATLNIPSYFYDTTDGVVFVKTIKDSSSYVCLTNANSYSKIIIPNSVANINYCAFSGCTSLTSISLPNSLTSINHTVFSRCTSLTSITIPNSVTSISPNVFYGCTSLTSITMPNSFKLIPNVMFKECISLTSITIPSSVITIYDSAFSGCTNLTTITIPSNVTRIDGLVFDGCTKLTSITFEKTDNWQYSSDSGKTYSDLTADMSLTDPAVNATKFTGDWVNYYFRQKGTN